MYDFRRFSTRYFPARVNTNIVKLRKKNLFLKNPRIVEKKPGKARTLYLSSLQELIREYTKDQEPADDLFPSNKGSHLEVNVVNQIFQKVAKLLGRGGIDRLMLRQSFDYRYCKKTKDAATLMEIFGSSNEEIMKRYAGIIEDEISETLLNFSLGL